MHESRLSSGDDRIIRWRWWVLLCGGSSSARQPLKRYGVSSDALAGSSLDLP